MVLFVKENNIICRLTEHNTVTLYGQATPERKQCRSIGFLYYPVYLPHQAKVIF